jgi:NitT/TauT family transport system ATP-binding protein
MEMIRLVGLDGHENKFAKSPNLSGGQLQRVAVARNLVSGGKIMLLDEPNSGLDVRTKLEMGDLFCNVWNELKKKVDVTFLMVTHDLQEAVYLADRIYVMDSNPGRIIENIKIELPSDKNRLVKREKKFGEYVYYLEDLMTKLKKK